MRIIIFIFIFNFINLSFENCQNCLEGEIYVYRNMIPETTSRCWGILSCNHAICATYRRESVSFVVLKINNTSRSYFKEYKISEACIENQVIIIGVDYNYNTMSDATKVCSGLLSCNEAICTINKM